jgi:pectin methylesterase-like acyl-CoA thioesterase
MKFICTLFFVVFGFLHIANAQINATVAADGSGTFTTLQAAINAAPVNSTTPWVIFIKNGKYYEKINVPSNKPFLQLIGQSVNDVIVFYDDWAGKTTTGGGTIGTGGSSSITISANDFTAINITFANTFKYDSAVAAGVTGTQAVAVSVNGDRAAFKNCRFTGMQDTLYTKGARCYFLQCYIDGIVDFIFGSSIAIFDSCVIYPKARSGTGNSFITAANTAIGSTYGYLLKDCKIPANTGATLYYLGRPWQNATAGNTAENKVVLMNTTMSNSVNVLGWSVWDAGTNTSIITNAEYKSKKFDGSLVNIASRVAWSKQFANADTVGYNILNMFGGWNPCGVRADFCNYQQSELAVSNVAATKTTQTNISWNICWPINGITYEVYKSVNNKSSFALLSSVISTNDTSINFQSTDVLPIAGSKHYYVIKSIKSGYSTTFSDTIVVSSIPTIFTTTNSLSNFLQGSLAPSAAQTFYVNGANLPADISIIPPANFEISLDNSTWKTTATPIVLAATSGTVANTLIYVRLNATTAASYADTILLQSIGGGLIAKNKVTVSGVTQSTPLLVYEVVQQWKMAVDNVDDAATRSMGLEATIATFNKLFVSNGTTLATIAAYSSQFGQAFGASLNGDGSWGTAIGGPGGNVNRNYYEQFTIKPSTGYTVKIDSIIATTAFYNTSSGTKLAVAYSLSNFTLDSSNVTGGRDGFGVTLVNTANGSFATPIGLLNQTGGPTATYGLALNAGTGVNIAAGQTLTIRLYYACGSTGIPRYAMLKNVQIKGTTPLLLSSTLYNLKAIETNNVAKISFATSNEINVLKYDIEKSVDGKVFTKIATLQAKGNSEYLFFDENCFSKSNVVYYRIVTIDNDGKTNYSTIKILLLKSKTSTISVYPNPAKNLLQINVDPVDSKRQLCVYNNEGKICLSKLIIANSTKENLDISTLQVGMYHISIFEKGIKKEIVSFVKNEQ